MTMQHSQARVRTAEGETEDFEINLGVRQGDGLSTTLFILTLDAVIKECNFTGTIINKTTQVVAYADDLTVIARDRRSLEGAIRKIQHETEKRGLTINQKKSKYMEIRRENKGVRTKVVKIGKYEFETVENFKYLGIIISNKSDRNMEIDHRIQAGYRAYHKYKSIMKSKSISIRTKLKAYKAAIRPVVTYGAEIMNLTSQEQEKLRIFERKIVRRIYGLKKITNDEYRRLMNFEIQTILRGEDIVKLIKVQRLRWFGHIRRMDDGKEVKKITRWKPDIGRGRGRPKSRWEDQVLEDIRKLEIQAWWEKVQDRDTWKKVTEEAKADNRIE